VDGINKGAHIKAVLMDCPALASTVSDQLTANRQHCLLDQLLIIALFVGLLCLRQEIQIRLLATLVECSVVLVLLMHFDQVGVLSQS